MDTPDKEKRKAECLKGNHELLLLLRAKRAGSAHLKEEGVAHRGKKGIFESLSVESYELHPNPYAIRVRWCKYCGAVQVDQLYDGSFDRSFVDDLKPLLFLAE